MISGVFFCRQESLPPVQFDWSSSGLTNPLDGKTDQSFLDEERRRETSFSHSQKYENVPRVAKTTRLYSLHV